LRDEDSLFDVILNHGEYSTLLLSYVHCKYLTVSSIDRLLIWISLDEVDSRLWASLSRRLRFVHYDAALDSSRPFDGIVSYLTSKSGGNIHTQGSVTSTASSTGHNQCHQVADPRWEDYWYSADSSNEWIQFDFRHRRMSLTNYIIKSDGCRGDYLLHWPIEGSEDGLSSITLDRQANRDWTGSTSFNLIPAAR
jgi:hypothetical protein